MSFRHFFSTTPSRFSTSHFLHKNEAKKSLPLIIQMHCVTVDLEFAAVGFFSLLQREFLSLPLRPAHFPSILTHFPFQEIWGGGSALPQKGRGGKGIHLIWHTKGKVKHEYLLLILFLMDSHPKQIYKLSFIASHWGMSFAPRAWTPPASIPPIGQGQGQSR